MLKEKKNKKKVVIKVEKPVDSNEVDLASGVGGTEPKENVCICETLVKE